MKNRFVKIIGVITGLSILFGSFSGAQMTTDAAEIMPHPAYISEQKVAVAAYQSPAEESFSLNLNKLELLVGKTYRLKAKPASGKIKWSSSNRKIATVSAKGIVTGKKVGTVQIKAKWVAKKQTAVCKVRITGKLTQSQVERKILSMQKKYPEGKKWSNDNYYYWKSINTHCYGCVALVGKMSDKIFGKKKRVKRHHSFRKIKSGDHVRLGNYHSVMVIRKKGNVLTVVEGNYNFSIHWKREITKAELKADRFYVETRY